MTLIRLGRPKATQKLKVVLAVALLGVFGFSCASVPRSHHERRGLFDSRKNALYSRTVETRSAGPVPVEQRGAEAAIKKLRPFLSKWQWPLDRVHITSYFGKRGQEGFHEGIDLKAPTGTNVYAVDAGKVIYAGNRIGGYGKMVVIRHKGGLASVYAHNSSIRVRTGESVSQGEKIAVSGNTGRSSGPHLHFEVRYGVVALDPGRVLPRDQVKSTSARSLQAQDKRPVRKISKQQKYKRKKKAPKRRKRLAARH